ncbi:MAG TPA: tetratricopeptide repeat protein [Streptosporangiaceae bacterium]|nr:tetratricopeptide repeat protein [Streptosporangiaceae bacterium]
MTQPRNFSLHGAVDLGARQAAAKRRQQATQSTEAGDSAFVIEATDATFNTDVVARSQSVPVIIDLWADWCEPCKQLGPVLEKLADEAAGAWILAKVDVDANPQLAAALQVQSIPMVVAVVGGQLVDAFLGALPEAQVRAWIGQILAVAQQLGLPVAQNGGAAADASTEAAGDTNRMGRGPLSPEEELLSDPRFKAAQDAMDIGDLNGASNALEQVLDDTPGHPVAKAWLAQVELFKRVNSYDPAKVRRAAAEKPDDPDAQASMADVELANGQIEAAFDRMLTVIGRTAGDDRDKARLHLLGLFEIMPPRDPRVTKARGKLSSLLF